MIQLETLGPPSAPRRQSPTRPVRSRLADLLTAAVVALVPALAGCGAPTERPNVVVILVDDLGWADTGVYGSTFYETPAIDRLAGEGAILTQFYAASSVCSPTRASIMSGKHPARLDLTNWIGGEQDGLLRQADYIRQLPLEEVTFGEAFQEAGYATGYIGKWHLGREGYLPDMQGFDYTFAVNQAGQPGSYFPPYENPNWALTNVPDLKGDPEGAYLTDRLTDAAEAFVRGDREKPFLLVLSHYAVHTPLQAPEETVSHYRAKAALLGEATEDHYRTDHGSSTKLRQDHPTYAAMVKRTDDSVARVLEALDGEGILDETIVVLLSDNGGLSTLVRRGLNQATSNEPLRSGKGWLYEGGIRSPFIVRYPLRIRPGTVDIQPAMTTDLYPTLLGLAGLEGRPLQHLDGTDLSTRLAGGESSAVAQYWHFPHYHGSGNRPGGAIRQGDLKLVEWFEDGAVELYDLAADPGEKLDLSQSRKEDAARLREDLHQWRERVEANMPTVLD
jgi:arylsulfatase A-like enzyme